MARYRDDDDRDDRRDRDDRDDDRPRRRSRDDYDDRPPPKKAGGVGTVLLIVGLAVGLPLLICGGIGLYIFFQVKQGVEQAFGTVQSHAAAETFLDVLERNDVSGAYTNYTTTGFRSGTSKEQFEKLVKANPVLLASNTHTQNGFPSPTGTAPNRKLVLIYTVNSFGGGNGLDDPDEDDVNPKPGGVRPKKRSKKSVISVARKKAATDEHRKHRSDRRPC